MRLKCWAKSYQKTHTVQCKVLDQMVKCSLNWIHCASVGMKQVGITKPEQRISDVGWKFSCELNLAVNKCVHEASILACAISKCKQTSTMHTASTLLQGIDQQMCPSTNMIVSPICALLQGIMYVHCGMPFYRDCPSTLPFYRDCPSTLPFYRECPSTLPFYPALLQGMPFFRAWCLL
jgi:hypothetical protein